jgi:hypothetical protein
MTILFIFFTVIAFAGGACAYPVIQHIRQKYRVKQYLKKLGKPLLEVKTSAEAWALKQGMCRIVAKDQKQYLASPAGEIFKMQRFTKVKQGIHESMGGYAIATVELYVLLDNTIEKPA